MIVDVFRAFTTAAFCVGAGAREIVLVRDHEQALTMKRADPTLFLTGEIDGRPIPGFDAGNSPTVIERLDLRGRRVVQRTSSGTQGVVAASGARDQEAIFAMNGQRESEPVHVEGKLGVASREPVVPRFYESDFGRREGILA